MCLPEITAFDDQVSHFCSSSSFPPPLLERICNLLDEPPDVTCMRCVPAAWCVPTSVTPFKVWDDTGAGGGKPGSIWTVNSLDMVAVIAGHEPPKEIFYEFKSMTFSLDGMLAGDAGKH